MQKFPLPQTALPDIAISFEDDFMRSNTHDDIYFSAEGGLAESDYVFCDGTDLETLLKTRSHITIAETGFGTGLNLCAVQRLRDKVGSQCQIDYISFEACPLTADIIAKAHRPFPEIERYSAQLQKGLPPRWPGYHKVILDEGRFHLHLYYGVALPLLKTCSFKADVWFLDGFNPRKNDDLWDEEVLAEIGRCSSAGARLATFTVAATVRNGLERAGFQLTKRAGFGKKRDMLTAVMPGFLREASQPQRVAIIGGGIAGASLVRACLNRNITPILIEKAPHLAAGASGNPIGIQSARIRVHHDELSRLSVSCLSFASHLAAKEGAMAHEGSILISHTDKELKRQHKLTDQNWHEDLHLPISPSEIAEKTGFPATHDGVYQAASSMIKPPHFVTSLAQGAALYLGDEVVNSEAGDNGVTLTLASGAVLEVDKVILATGAAMPHLLTLCGLPHIPLDVSAGQISIFEGDNAKSDLTTGLHFGGYLTPVIEGAQYMGASFDRSGQTDVTETGHQHNFGLLPPPWQDSGPQIQGAKGRLSHRLATTDRLPLVGEITAQFHVMTALGARGLTHAPLLAEVAVANLCDCPTGFDQEVIEAIAPARYL